MKLSAHEVFFLLKNSLGIPRLQYLLRTAPCCLSSEAERLDEAVRDTLALVVNLRLDDSAWAQASLPVRWGGVGIRRSSVLAPSAFLSSASASAPLIGALILEECLTFPDRLLEEAVARWSILAGAAFPAGHEATSQRALDDVISQAISNAFFVLADPVNRPRLLASLSPNSGAWLQALPCSSLDLRLGNNELRVAVGHRLGARTKGV